MIKLYNILTKQYIDESILPNIDDNYICNKDLIFFDETFAFKYENDYFIPKDFKSLRRIWNGVSFLKNRSDVDLQLDDDTINLFKKMKSKEMNQGNIFYEILNKGEPNMAIFKFSVVDLKDHIKFINPLPLDANIGEGFDTENNIVYVRSPNIYNVICGALEDGKYVYTYFDRLFNLQLEDILFKDDGNDDTVEMTLFEKSQIEFNRLNGKINLKIQSMLLEYNMLLLYFQSIGIAMDLITNTNLEETYENIIEYIDEHELDVDDSVFDKVERLLKMTFDINIYRNMLECYFDLKENCYNEECFKKFMEAIHNIKF